MALPDTGPATLALVKVHQGITDNTDDARITSVVDAVNAVVRAWPVAGVAEGLDDWEAPAVAHVVEGSVMLAARLFRRRNSPDGVAAFGQAGPVYVQRNDPDVAMLLKLGPYKRPQAR